MKFKGENNTWVTDDHFWREGGNSYIYIGKTKAQGDPDFALKLFKAEIRKEIRRKRFMGEIDILRRVKEIPGCVEYLDHGIKNNVPFVVTKLYRGGDFSDRYIKSKCQEPAYETMNKFLELLQIVKRLHDQDPRLAVRDIKPQNIFLKDDLTPVIGDFGLSLFSDTPDEERLTIFSQIGSQGYRPPEWTEKYLPSDHTSGDIWSLGRVLWAIFSQKHPPNNFEPLGIKENHLKNFIPLDFANYIQGLVNYCHELDPYNRPSINDLICQTKEILEGLKSLSFGKSSNSDIQDELRDFKLIAEGSQKKTDGIKKNQEEVLEKQDFNQARDIFLKEFSRLKTLISKSIPSNCGKVALINNTSGPISSQSVAPIYEMGISFYPPEEHLKGGSSIVSFSIKISRHKTKKFECQEIKSNKKPGGEGSSSMGSKFTKSLLNFANQRCNKYYEKTVVLEWFIPAIKKAIS